MKFTRKEKRIYALLLSMAFFLIIFALYKNSGSSHSNELRNLIESDKAIKRCDKCDKERKESENEYNKNTIEFQFEKKDLDKYSEVLKEIIEEKDSKKITKYLPRVLTYLIVAIVGVIFIVFWFVFCCSACKKVGRQDSIGCGAKCCFFIFIIISLGVIFFCALGIIYTPHLEKALNRVACSTYKLVFDFLEGSNITEFHWVGFNNISQESELKNIDKNIYKEELEIIQKMNETFEDIKSNTLEDMEKIMDKIDDLYPNNSFLFFGGIALFNLLALLAMFLIFVYQCKCMSCLYHTFWNLEMIFIICTFFIAAILGGFSNVSKDISEILRYQTNILVSGNENMTFILNFSEISPQFNVCLNGDNDYDLYSYIFKDNDPLNVEEKNLKDYYSNCSIFKRDYTILVYELKDTVPKKLFYVSLLYIIADVAGIISIFFGIIIYNSQKGYYPHNDVNVNINNRMPNNNRIDLSTENLKRQNNDMIFSKK